MINRYFGDIVRSAGRHFERWREYRNSRINAKKLRSKVIAYKGKSLVSRKLLNRIKKYSKSRFGTSQFWPWLALYTELRGEFIEGWIPDDYYTYVLLPKINPRNIAYLSTFKTFDHRLFGDFMINPIAVIIGGKIYDSEQKRLDEKKLFKILKNIDSEVVMKRDNSPSGMEIDFLHSSKIDRGYFQDDVNYLIQPVIRQHAVLDSIHPSSVNTLRITTYFDSKKRIKILDRSLRIGTDGNRIVNERDLFVYLDGIGNIISNGIDLTELNIDTGPFHPDTKINYRDLKIPSVPKAEELCIRSHIQFPYLRLIGWDVCIDRSGTPKLIEWNAVRPDIWVDEALKGPLWPEW